MDDVDRFEEGRLRGMNPQPAGDAIATDGRAITSPASPWNHDRCHRCGQTFRRGDAVEITLRPHYVVVHTDPWMACGGTGVEDAHGSPGDDDAGFAAGLLSAFPVAGGIPVQRLAVHDWRVATPDRTDPPRCLYCGHTFRAGEYVVVCPCGPLTPNCGAAVHRDPAAGLSCWEAWRPDSTLSVCPVTLVRISGTD
jgi:hypothetical protein